MVPRHARSACPRTHGIAVAVRDQLLSIIGEITGEHSTPVAGDGDLVHTYGLDSIQLVRLIGRIEADFGLVFGRDPADMKALASLESLARWIEEHG